MNSRPKLGSRELGRLRQLVARSSVDRDLVSEPRELGSTIPPHHVRPNALAALLESESPYHSALALLTAGAKVGRYEMVRLLGMGGMGVVYEAVDPLLGRRIALKLLRTRRGEDAVRALNEARALAQITHANVVTAFDVGQADDITYVAMALIEGASLRRQLGIWARPWKRLEPTFIQVGRALQAAHEAGLVHCDVKPDNVLVDRRGHAYVADFGLARCFVPQGTPTATADSLLRERRWFGTPGYVAPELEQGQDPSPHTDQFSFCVMVTEALIGQAPETQPDSPVPIHERLVTLLEGAAAPRHVKRALQRGLEPSPEARFPDMAALLRALERPTRRRVFLIGLGIAAVVATVVANMGGQRASIAPSALTHVDASVTSATPVGEVVASPLTQAAPVETVLPSRSSTLVEISVLSETTTPESAPTSLVRPVALPALRRRDSAVKGTSSEPAKTVGVPPASVPTVATSAGASRLPFGPRK